MFFRSLLIDSLSSQKVDIPSKASKVGVVILKLKANLSSTFTGLANWN